MANSSKARYRRARRALDRQIARAIDEAITSAYLETSQEVTGEVSSFPSLTFLIFQL